jgi:hypothetical protein
LARRPRCSSFSRATPSGRSYPSYFGCSNLATWTGSKRAPRTIAAGSSSTAPSRPIDDGAHPTGAAIGPRLSAIEPEAGHRLRPRCLIPAFDGAIFSQERKDAVWARFFTAAPRQQRRSVERYNIVPDQPDRRVPCPSGRRWCGQRGVRLGTRAGSWCRLSEIFPCSHGLQWSATWNSA